MNKSFLKTDKAAQRVGGVGGADPRLLFAEGKFLENSKEKSVSYAICCNVSVERALNTGKVKG